MITIRSLVLLAVGLSGVLATPVPIEKRGELEPDEGGYLYQCAADPDMCSAKAKRALEMRRGELEPDEGGYLYQCAADPDMCSAKAKRALEMKRGELEPDEGGYLYQCAADPDMC